MFEQPERCIRSLGLSMPLGRYPCISLKVSLHLCAFVSDVLATQHVHDLHTAI